MRRLGASKIALSTLSSRELWKQSGRIDDEPSDFPEIFQLQDRRDVEYVLSPTHEEEITSLVGGLVQSYKTLPLRLYQITRKYRDEARPRQGLLRTKEFLMKDLYTFDATESDAIKTYESVQQAYNAFFGELKIDYQVVEASSGSIGGDLSHEYHFPSARGEDNLVFCDSCSYSANEEVVELTYPTQEKHEVRAIVQNASDLQTYVRKPQGPSKSYRQWFGAIKGTNSLLQVIIPTQAGLQAVGITSYEEPRVDIGKIQEVLGGIELDGSVDLNHEDIQKTILKSPNKALIYRMFDGMIAKPPSSAEPMEIGVHKVPVQELSLPLAGMRLIRAVNGDQCPTCNHGRLRIRPAIEVGHTFHLGTRYSKPLAAKFAPQVSGLGQEPTEGREDSKANWAYLQMGCHGIGVSRLIAAVADILSDSGGLHWPRVVAPFEALIIPGPRISREDQLRIYDALNPPDQQQQHSSPSPPTTTVDTILDDRASKPLSWKLKDADLIGYPIRIVIGREWAKGKGTCEVACRRLGVKEDVRLEDLKVEVLKILDRL